MKLDLECIRDVLLKLEDLDYENRSNVEMLHAQLPQYTENQISYTCIKLSEAGFIRADVLNIMGHVNPQVGKIYDITYNGHQFIENIRSENVWVKTKNIASNVGSASLNAISLIASNIISDLIKRSF
ncbi:MAG: DUF2513 domain-containing protein [Clostridia bacterium]|nr:DUF2513 domain-containing protein [Clostridia bacterium]